MKKIIYALAAMALTATLMVGCGANAADSKQDTKKSATTEDGATKPKNVQKVDLAGEVASIDGNKIVIKIIKAPETPQESNQKDASKDGDKEKSKDNKDGQVPRTPANMKREFTGENKDIVIGDGIQIATMTKGKQGVETKDLTINDIKVGDILQIIYSDKEKETISKIYVRSAENQNGSTSAK